jgi:hypothetical protein
MHARGGCNDHGGFRYYESAYAAWAFRQRIRKTRAQAPQLERLVLEQLRSLLLDRAQLRLLLMKLEVYGPELERLAAAGSEAAVRLQRLPVRQLSCVLKAVVNRVEVHSEFVRILVTLEALRLFLLWDGVGLFALSELDQIRAGSMEVLDVQAVVERERKKHCLPVEPRTGTAAAPDSRLLMLLEDAREAQRLVFEQREVPVADLAYSLGRKPASFARLVRLNYLAPDIVTAILDGEQPPGLSRKRLMEVDLPTDWAIQRRLLGFPARHAVSQTPPFNAGGGKDGNGQR